MSSTGCADKLVISQQSFYDPTLDAEVEFTVVQGSAEPYRITLSFRRPDEVRELRFGEDGDKSGSSTRFPRD